MNKLYRVHGGGGGGGGGGSWPNGQKTVWTMGFFLVLNLFYSLQRGSNGFITETVQHFPGGGPTSSRGWGGVSKETHITCDFPGGSRPSIPPRDPHMGSPEATVCLQNHGLSKFK